MLRPARAACGAHACACGAHAYAHLWVGGVLRVQGGAVLVQARQHRFEERPRRHARPRVGCGEGLRESFWAGCSPPFLLPWPTGCS